MILAESRYLAEDAAELATIDLEPLPALVDPEEALEPGAPCCMTIRYQPHRRIHASPRATSRRARSRAAQFERRFHHHRYAPSRWNAAAWSGPMRRAPTVTIWSSMQVVHWVRREASTVLSLPEARIRCVALDVGGGFGVKGHVYPEDLLIPFLARAVSGRCDGSRTAMSICRPAIRATRSTTSRSASTTTAGCSRCATASSPIAAPGIRSAPASPTTPRSICPGPTRSTISRRRADRRDQQGAKRALSRRRPA